MCVCVCVCSGVSHYKAPVSPEEALRKQSRPMRVIRPLQFVHPRDTGQASFRSTSTFPAGWLPQSSKRSGPQFQKRNHTLLFFIIIRSLNRVSYWPNILPENMHQIRSHSKKEIVFRRKILKIIPSIIIMFSYFTGTHFFTREEISLIHQVHLVVISEIKTSTSLNK